jgi:hypothetical protein
MFLMVKISHFAITKSPKQHDQGNFSKKIPKNCHILRKRSYEIVKISGGFRQISSCLLLKLSYLANRSTGSMIPLFSTPRFVFVAIFGQTLLWLLATFGAT